MISLVFDTETTGPISKPDWTDPAISSLVQIFAALYEHEEHSDDFIVDNVNMQKPFAVLSTIIDADMDVPKGAFDVHGIDRKKMRRLGVDPANVAHLMEDFFDITDVIVAHNKRFDLGIIKRFLHVNGRDASFIDEKANFCTMNALRPVMQITPKVYGDFKNPKLIEAYRYVFNRDFDGEAHDASADAVAAADLYFACLQMHIPDPSVKV